MRSWCWPSTTTTKTGADKIVQWSILQQGVGIAYNNVNILKMGAEYTPRRYDVRKYYNRISYRAGVRYGGYQYTFGGEDIREYTLTAGAGFPFNNLGISKIDIGLEWGKIGSLKTISGTDIGLVRQNYLKFALGFTMFGEDYWFRRPEID